MKLNPYHYPIFDNRLTTLYRGDLEEILDGSTNIDMNGLNEAIVRQASILDKVFKILHCRYNNVEIASFDCLRKIQAQNVINRKVEEPDYWTDLENPIDLASIMMVIACTKPKNTNWSAFRELHLSLNKEQASDLALIFDIIYQTNLDNLFDEPKGLWEFPQKIDELKEQIRANGVGFLKTGDGKWKRTDLAIKNFHVSIIKKKEEYDDETDELKCYKKSSVVGCAATFEGAIEVASRVISRLKAKYEVDNEGMSVRVNNECIELHIKDSNGEVLLRANLKEESADNYYSSFSVGYEAEWVEVIPRNNVEYALEKIKQLIDEASEESRWDNYYTADNLRKAAQNIRDRLPSKNYDSYKLHEKLRYTLGVLGDNKQTRKLLIQDLSL